MWDTLRFNRFKVFTKPRGLYIPAWAHELCSDYSDLVPQGKKKSSDFKLVDFIVVRGKKVKCRIDDINVEFKWATEFMHDYKSMIKTKTLDDLKCLLTLLFLTSP